MSRDGEEWSDIDETGRREVNGLSDVISKLQDQGLEVSATTLTKNTQYQPGGLQRKARGSKVKLIRGRGRGRGGPGNQQ